MPRRRNFGQAFQNINQILQQILQNRLIEKRQLTLNEAIGERQLKTAEAASIDALRAKGIEDPKFAERLQRGGFPGMEAFIPTQSERDAPVRRQLADTTGFDNLLSKEGVISSRLAEGRIGGQIEPGEDLPSEGLAGINSLLRQQGATKERVLEALPEFSEERFNPETLARETFTQSGADRFRSLQDAGETGITTTADATPQQLAQQDLSQQETFREGGGPAGLGADETSQVLTGKLSEDQVSAEVDKAGRIAAAQERARITEQANAVIASGDEDLQTQYILNTATRVVEGIDGVFGKINAFTAGFGSLLRFKPGSAAADVAAELRQITANIAFEALTAMRAASETGGGLGQISNIEIELLQSVEGSLSQDQSPQNLRNQLQRVKASMQRVIDAANIQGATLPEGLQELSLKGRILRERGGR